jgi:hypothetical protein
MAAQGQLDRNGHQEGNGREPIPPRVVVHNVSELLHDSLTLGDLQLRLLWADSRRLAADLVYPGVLLVVGAVLVLSCVPVALASVALALAETTRLTLAQAFGFTLAGGLVSGGLIVLGAAVWLRRGLNPFARSLAELDANVRWIKKLLRDSSTARQREQRVQGA